MHQNLPPLAMLWRREAALDAGLAWIAQLPGARASVHVKPRTGGGRYDDYGWANIDDGV